MAFDVNDFKYQFHSVKGDVGANFELQETDLPSTGIKYLGYVSLDDRWIIRKVDGGTHSFSYGRANFSIAWLGKSLLTYFPYEELIENVV